MTTGSLRAFARYAKENGMESDAVSYYHRQKTAGRLVMVSQDGKEVVDFEASMASLRSSADPARAYMTEVNERQRAARRGTTPKARPEPEPEPEREDEPAPQASGGPKGATYMQAKTVREAAEAQMARLRLSEMKRDLIRVASIKAELANVISATREGLLQIPARIAPMLAAETDPSSVQTLLHEEIHRALMNLSGAADRLDQPEGVA